MPLYTRLSTLQIVYLCVDGAFRAMENLGGSSFLWHWVVSWWNSTSDVSSHWLVLTLYYIRKEPSLVTHPALLKLFKDLDTLYVCATKLLNVEALWNVTNIPKGNRETLQKLKCCSVALVFCTGSCKCFASWLVLHCCCCNGAEKNALAVAMVMHLSGANLNVTSFVGGPFYSRYGPFTHPIKGFE